MPLASLRHAGPDQLPLPKTAHFEAITAPYRIDYRIFRPGAGSARSERFLEPPGPGQCPAGKGLVITDSTDSDIGCAEEETTEEVQMPKIKRSVVVSCRS